MKKTVAGGETVITGIAQTPLSGGVALSSGVSNTLINLRALVAQDGMSISEVKTGTGVGIAIGPGQSVATTATPTFAGLNLWTPAKPWVDVVTDMTGALAPAFPTTLSLPLEGTASFQFAQTDMTFGNYVVFTVPAGKYAFLTTLNVLNRNGASVLVRLWASPDGGVTRYCLSNGVTVAAGVSTAFPLFGYVFLPGDSIVFESNTPTLVFQMNGAGLMWTTSTSPLRPLVARGLAAGDTDVYVCPAGMNATSLGATQTLVHGAGPPRWAQQSGLSVTYTQLVTTGGITFENSFSVAPNASVGTGNAISHTLAPGDKLTINAASAHASSHYWILLIEFPLGILAPAITSAVSRVREEMKRSYEPEDDDYEIA